MGRGSAPEIDPELRAEYQSLARSIADQRERAERLQLLADQARENAERQTHALRDLAELLGLEPQMCLDQLDERLRGRRLQEIAVQVLAESVGPGEPVHYRQWYGLLRDSGYAVGGQDPLRTFLAAISRASDVEAVGSRSGLYVLAPPAELKAA
jgi:hypothetical protein